MHFQSTFGSFCTRGFNLTKWSSNQVSVLKFIPESERAADVKEIGEPLPVGTALGILWNKNEDAFVFKVDGDLKCTTRRQDKLPFEVFCAALILYDRDTVIFAGGQNRSGPISSTFAFSLANASSKELGNLSEAKYGGSLVDCGKN